MNTQTAPYPDALADLVLRTSYRLGPYAPHHGPGNDPYIVFEHGTDVDVRTSFRGDLNPPS